MNALIDTGLLVDYLWGERRAAQALADCELRCISAVTWVEVMAACPAAVVPATRGFLRSFERLSINEAIADEAWRLLVERPAVPLQRALTWATASINQLTFLTTDAAGVLRTDLNVCLAYRSGTKRPVMQRGAAPAPLDKP